MRAVLLVCGSRQLAYHPGARDVCRATLARTLAALSDLGYPQATLLHGGALGPDSWAGEVAAERGLQAVTYLPDGRRLDTHAEPRRWAPGDPGPLARNRAMVAAAARVWREGWAVSVVGLVTPWRAATHGTDATLGHARQAGLPVARVVVPAVVR